MGLATVQLAAGRDAEARAAAGQAVVLLEAVLERSPGASSWRPFLASAAPPGAGAPGRGRPGRLGGRLAAQVAIYEKMPPRDPESAFLEACCHAMLAGAAAGRAA